MGLSNQHGHLVLATGNKSELAVGYSTLYGDAVGGFAPIKDVPKTLVWRLARWRNARRRGARRDAADPGGSISKPPSAELRPGPARHRLAARLRGARRHPRRLRRAGPRLGELVAAGFDQELVEKVLRLVDHAEYKRRQYPPGTEDLAQGVRPGPPAADHEPLAASTAPPSRDSSTRRGTMRVSGDSRWRSLEACYGGSTMTDATTPETTAPYGTGPAAAGAAAQAGAGPPPAGDEGARRAVRHADRLRPVRRPRSSTRPASRCCSSATRRPTTSSATRRRCP